MRKLLLLTIFLTLLLVVRHPEWTSAQNTNPPNLPQIMNTANQYAMIGNQYYDWTIGEMVLTQTFNFSTQALTQGFLQPIPQTITPPDEPNAPENCDLPVQLNNVITPNGDGKNDRLVFRCLEHFPDNLLRIYDRAGRMVYNTKGYQNDWSGEQNGRALNEDTYYYVLEAEKNLGRIKGFISIIRDQF